MPDKRTSLTPIIVGVIIALLGILTGLYIADNARSQLAAAHTEQALESTEQEEAANPMPVAPVDELPAAIDEPLPDIVIDPLPVEHEATEEQEHPSDVGEPARQEPVEIDDFEEVPMEELEPVVTQPADTNGI